MHPVSTATAKAGQHQGIKIKTWQLSGLGEKCTPPKPRS